MVTLTKEEVDLYFPWLLALGVMVLIVLGISLAAGIVMARAEISLGKLER